MIEPEPPQALSARKLVLETAKYNVITGYSAKEGLVLLDEFPLVSAVIIHGEIRDPACEDVVLEIKKKRPTVEVIVLSARPAYQCSGADHHVSSHEPTELLLLLRQLFGDPRTERPAA